MGGVVMGDGNSMADFADNYHRVLSKWNMGRHFLSKGLVASSEMLTAKHDISIVNFVDDIWKVTPLPLSAGPVSADRAIEVIRDGSDRLDRIMEEHGYVQNRAKMEIAADLMDRRENYKLYELVAREPERLGLTP